jgi:uncharacterized protein Yka (UPF0111/DUF47 family)
MRRRLGLIPRDESFFALFEKQAEVVRECLPILGAMRTTLAVDPQWAIAIEKIEQRCDSFTATIIRQAEKTFITPIDREDIYYLASAIDDVIDFIEELIIKLVDYKLVPDAALREFFELVSMGVTYISEGVLGLRKFQPMSDLRAKMKECEHRADALVRTLIRESYEIVIADIVKEVEFRTLMAADVQTIFDAYNDRRKRREIAELSEAAVDACERVFHILGNVYLKEM